MKELFRRIVQKIIARGLATDGKSGKMIENLVSLMLFMNSSKHRLLSRWQLRRGKTGIHQMADDAKADLHSSSWWTNRACLSFKEIKDHMLMVQSTISEITAGVAWGL